SPWSAGNRPGTLPDPHSPDLAAPARHAAAQDCSYLTVRARFASGWRLRWPAPTAPRQPPAWPVTLGRPGPGCREAPSRAPLSEPLPQPSAAWLAVAGTAARCW